MSDEPSTRELIAGYRASIGPDAAARERMWRTVAAGRRERPAVIEPPPRRSPAVWLALAAALVLVGLSSYLLLQAQNDARVAPGNLLMAPSVTPPEHGVTTPRERAATVPAPPSLEPPPTRDDTPPPTANDDTPIANDTTPTANDTTPIANDDTPIANDDTPTPNATTPIADDDTPPPSPRRRPRKPSEPTSDPVLAELELIQRIKDALDRGRWSEALVQVDQHARRFARGSLVEEREALRVVALCGALELERGQRARRSFLRDYPRSAYGERVRTACPPEL